MTQTARPARPEPSAPLRRPYEPPRLVRVRVQTARLAAGLVTALGHCTQHHHTDVGDCPTG